MKHFALCNFDCGFIKRKSGEEISSDKYLDMKQKLKPEILALFVRSEGSHKPELVIPEAESVVEEIDAEKPKKKGKK